MVGFFSAGSTASTASRLLFCTFSIKPDFAQRVDRAIQQHLNVFQLAAFPVILPGTAIGDKLRVRFEHRLDNPQLIGAQRRTGFGNFDDGVGQFRRLHFRCAPTELHLRVDAVSRQIALRRGNKFGRNDLAFQILHALER